MGWLWASRSSTAENAAESQFSREHATNSNNHNSDNGDIDNKADPELQKFMSLFQSEAGTGRPEPSMSESTTQSQSQSSSSDSNSSSSFSSWFALKSSPPSSSSSSSTSSSRDAALDPTAPSSETPKLDPLAESLLPTDMSCRQAFDMAFHCQSLGGQWNAVYRGGGVRSCSDHWDDFWFCMRVKGYSGPVREEAIREHYRKKELARYGPGKPSSEDVWRSRGSRVPPGTAFTTSLEEASVSDEDWQRMEMERRKQVRQQLGFDESKESVALP